MKKPLALGQTFNKVNVYLDTESSHVMTHLENSPGLLDLIKEAIPMIEATKENVYVDVDLGRVIGKSDLVETNESDEILYAKRIGRNIFTRFAKNRQAAETSFITLVLHRVEKAYRLHSAWIGQAVPPFPGDENEFPNSKEFWQSHALVWGNQAIQEGSQTLKQPW